MAWFGLHVVGSYQNHIIFQSQVPSTRYEKETKSFLLPLTLLDSPSSNPETKLFYIFNFWNHQNSLKKNSLNGDFI
jgi:hypothetical protein